MKRARAAEQIKLGYRMPARKKRSYAPAPRQVFCIQCGKPERLPGRRVCAECRAYLLDLAWREGV